VRNHIVEGEPGIFPDPIARLFRAIYRLFRRHPPPPPAAEPSPAPSESEGRQQSENNGEPG
jgi:hypothetical protein